MINGVLGDVGVLSPVVIEEFRFLFGLIFQVLLDDHGTVLLMDF